MNRRTFTTGQITHRMPGFPQPPTFIGSNNIRVDVNPDEKILHVKLQILDVIAAAAQASEPAWGNIGPQTINVKWQLFAPNSRITFQLEITAETLDNGTGRVLLFKDSNFRGLLLDISDGNNSIVSSELHDNASSIVVLDGNWIFYRHINFDSPYTVSGGGAIIVPKGLYPWIEDIGIKNDDLSSLRSVVW